MREGHGQCLPHRLGIRAREENGVRKRENIIEISKKPTHSQHSNPTNHPNHTTKYKQLRLKKKVRADLNETSALAFACKTLKITPRLSGNL